MRSLNGIRYHSSQLLLGAYIDRTTVCGDPKQRGGKRRSFLHVTYSNVYPKVRRATRRIAWVPRRVQVTGTRLLVIAWYCYRDIGSYKYPLNTQAMGSEDRLTRSVNMKLVNMQLA